MDEKCFVDGCRGTAKFSCSCDNKLQICQEHIAEHIRGPSYHDISASKKIQSLSQQRANEAIFTLSSLNSKALSEGKDMFKELCEKLCNIVDELSKRQQSLVDLSTSNYCQDVENKIQELEKVNITFRDKNDFKKLLDKFMSPGGDTFDSLSLEELKKDFKGILQSLNKSNEILEVVTGIHKEEQVLRKEHENRIENLEQSHGKIQNIDERLKRAELEAEGHLKIIENLRKELEKADIKVEAADKRLKEKCYEIQKQSKNQISQFQALENGIRKATEDNYLEMNKKYKELSEKVLDIEQVKGVGFKRMLEIFLEDVYNRRIAIEEERRRKEEEERRRKEEEDRLHPERKMNLKQRIDYFHPIVLNKWSDLNNCHTYGKEVLVSNDGKYLFFCKLYKGMIQQRPRKYQRQYLIRRLYKISKTVQDTKEMVKFNQVAARKVSTKKAVNFTEGNSKKGKINEDGIKKSGMKQAAGSKAMKVQSK